MSWSGWGRIIQHWWFWKSAFLCCCLQLFSFKSPKLKVQPGWKAVGRVYLPFWAWDWRTGRNWYHGSMICLEVCNEARRRRLYFDRMSFSVEQTNRSFLRGSILSTWYQLLSGYWCDNKIKRTPKLNDNNLMSFAVRRRWECWIPWSLLERPALSVHTFLTSYMTQYSILLFSRFTRFDLSRSLDSVSLNVLLQGRRHTRLFCLITFVYLISP